MLLPVLCWMHPYKRSGYEKDVAAGTGPAHHMDVVSETAGVHWGVDRDAAAAAEVSCCGCHAGCSQSHAMRLQRKRATNAEEQHQPLWCQPTHPGRIAPCCSHCCWAQLELPQMSEHEGKPTGKAGLVLTQGLFPKRPHAPPLPKNVIAHNAVVSRKFL